MTDLKKVIEESIKKLECSDDSETIVDYIYGIVTDTSSDDNEKKESLTDFISSLTENDPSECLDHIITIYNTDVKKSKEDTDKKLKETIKLQQELKLKEVTTEELLKEGEGVEETVNYSNLSKEEQKKREHFLAKYAYDIEEVDENGDIIFTDNNADKQKSDLQRTTASLGLNNNQARIVEEERLKREKAKAEHIKKVNRDKEALAKQKKDEEKKKTVKKEKRRL